jgi:hypothetical protein
MPDITLPQSGQTNWDVPLDAALTTVDTDATNALSNISNHSANVPADPHGDRAFAQSLVTPITAGTNAPNGYVKLDGTGHIPASLISGTSAGGMYTKVFDAVGLYGMTPGTSDTSTQFQSALTAAANAGGGLVYVGPGLFSLANYVIIGSNTWLLLSEGTILQRIQGITNPPYLISNVQFGTNNTPSTNFKISGGKLDAVGTQNLGSACTPVFAIQATKVEIRDLWINNVYNNPAIELNGCTVARVDWIHFTGAGSNSSAPTVPAIRINSSETATTPAGLLGSLYNNTVCQTIKITDCDTGPISGTTFGTYGSFCASDKSPVHKSLDITVTAISTRYNSLNNTPVDTSQWQNWSIDNCNFNETSNFVTGSEWATMTLKNNFSVGGDVNSANYPPAYRMMPDGTLAIRGALNTPNSGGVTGVTFATLGAAFGNTQPNPPTALVIQASGNHQGAVTIDSSGNLQLTGNFATNNNVYIDCTLRV